MTLTEGSGILRETRHLVMTIICAKQYFNANTNNNVMAGKRVCFNVTFNLDYKGSNQDSRETRHLIIKIICAKQ